MRHVQPEHVDEAIPGVVTMLKTAFHKVVEHRPQRGETVVPQIAVLCTVDPLTGKPFESFGVVIASVPHEGGVDDEVKDRLVEMARMIAVAGEAAATVVCLDAWMVVEDDASDAIKRDIRPSKHPRRREAMCVVVEKRGETKGSIEHHPYRRLDDGIAFDDSERRDGCDLQGRFAGLVPPHITPRQASTARMLLSMGGCGKIQVTEIG